MIGRQRLSGQGLSQCFGWVFLFGLFGGAMHPARASEPATDPALALRLMGASCLPQVTPAEVDGARRSLGGREPALHRVTDPVINPGQAPVLAGKFAYGKLSLDAGHEEVSVWFRADSCAEWTRVGEGETDGDGRFSLVLPSHWVRAPGVYEYRMVLNRDGSSADGIISVIERGRKAVVFDIDGTLTTRDLEAVEEYLKGKDSRMFEGAPTVANAYVRAGYAVVYLTGRPNALRPMTLAWLERHGFPRAPLIVSGSWPQALKVEKYKREWLEELSRDLGLSFEYAYGNATTDICAYAKAGIDPRSTFIIGKHRGESCKGYGPTQAVSSYPEHLKTQFPLPL